MCDQWGKGSKSHRQGDRLDLQIVKKNMKRRKGLEMKKKLLIILVTIILLASMSACNRSKYPGLTTDAIAFYEDSYVDVNDDDAEYTTIEYEGRTYLLYGTSNSSFQTKDVEKCIGYIVQEKNGASSSEEGDTDTRVYTLADDVECNYLMVYDSGSTLMNQPDFMRAIDTVHKEISTPEYIDSLEYSFWK
jgi:hypothetical protein